MTDWLYEFAQGLLDDFINPKKRIFIGYLLSAWCLAAIWLASRTTQLQLSQLVSPKRWFSRSALADYQLLIINNGLFLLLAPFLISQLSLSNHFYLTWFQWFGMPLSELAWQKWQVMCVFTVTLFLLDDFSRFFLHWLLHKVPFLWAFHQVHHSATQMTPLTVLRTHPVEGVLFYLRSALVQALVISLFIYCFGSQVDLISLFGVSIFLFAFNVLGANLRHSHVAIYYPQWLEKWLISPAMHQIHHSVAVRHFDKNLGSALAIWDRLFATLHHSEPHTQLQFGIDKTQAACEHNIIRLYVNPFKLAALALVPRSWRMKYVKKNA